ncbi:putative NADP-dependent alcohol dehydrogenase [Clavispora lusitaniae]|uniref:NADP-dependent alcohol dehydrogenase n=1 Tax=Clavispora lusitaniae TaxID=36911 RepID=A0ACD0WME0_CLALS|nr:putative NADP-dependent alcohol dehydrogenase [Clavispora lusitaniae]QFZ34223.1 putative NADP-dependent alcohol dehydrogenase [Clavispora lusitaniae]QFZ39907.1 putative NADP-dependent alcohol dehydrogenase [Clavispora lusitaniae]QFZ45589.1 putative NADP-dependent alcohol dehydrogenase [Clavispora lusitaniae]QFZ51253.1 putative NADP-dependent alcohol dehydrogenase [Clavispora lusitaniae]
MVTSSSVPDTFKGFAVDTKENWNKPKLVTYKRKSIQPTDVVIKNICCGLCGTDIHTTQENWGPMQRPDTVVGHEIIGTVIAVGDEVTEVKVGDRVGVGAASSSCCACSRCGSDNEQYCKDGVSTYNSIDGFSDGYVTQGGYSSHSIANQKFVFPIPDELDSVSAAPLMCAGLTVYSPIVRNIRHIEKPVVAVIGIGGLGHLALQFAKALGAEVYAFSRTSSKKAEATSLGADGFIATQEEKDWASKFHDKFDLILNCASRVDGFSLDEYLSALKVDGRFVSVGLPPVDDKFELNPFSFLSNGGSFGSSLLGSKKEALDMLELAAKKGVKPIVEEIPISEKNCEIALTRCNDGDVRYRFVFTDYDKAFA